MPMEPPPDLASLSLADIARLADTQRLPPVDRWHPTHCGDSEMRIARDGTWFHQGSPIGRQEMVRLFSTILRREPDGGYRLELTEALVMMSRQMPNLRRTGPAPWPSMIGVTGPRSLPIAFDSW